MVSLTTDAVAGPSWGEIFDAVDPLPPEMSEHCPASGPLDFVMAGDDELSDLDLEIPFLGNSEDYDPSPPPSGRVAKPTSSGAGRPGHDMDELDFDLNDVCKRAAAN
ncbi:hypothetical protein ILYODFUR_038448 [Ilyodon furcidens]|uniref:Uncharacterized protein n=1 Tax=Ilyodon furcidens TaxID=33524 RepID=A0ABV0UFV3_9TELE